MRFVIAALAAALATANKTEVPSFNDATYLAKSRSEKLEQIMTQVNVNTKPQKWYNSLTLTGIFQESMEPTLNQVGDEMPKTTFSTRKKYIHTEGTVASVKLDNIQDHPFTGVFEEADSGVVRLSFAAEPSHKEDTTPGMALKFLRDGIDSASLVAMYSVDGQKSFNFFKNDFTNHIPAVKSISLKPLASKFHSATDYVQAVGLSDWSQFDQSGKKIDEWAFPFSLRFHPTGRIEFPDEWDGTYFLDHLMTIPQGSTLYEVYGMDAPGELGGKEYHIGDLVTTSAMTTSTWGDDHLFFRHQWAEADVELKPEWKEYYPKYGNSMVGELSEKIATRVAEGITGCPFAYLWS